MQRRSALKPADLKYYKTSSTISIIILTFTKLNKSIAAISYMNLIGQEIRHFVPSFQAISSMHRKETATLRSHPGLL